jgi:hypothetical protein
MWQDMATETTELECDITVITTEQECKSKRNGLKVDKGMGGCINANQHSRTGHAAMAAGLAEAGGAALMRAARAADGATPVHIEAAAGRTEVIAALARAPGAAAAMGGGWAQAIHFQHAMQGPPWPGPGFLEAPLCTYWSIPLPDSGRRSPGTERVSKCSSGDHLPCNPQSSSAPCGPSAETPSVRPRNLTI